MQSIISIVLSKNLKSQPSCEGYGTQLKSCKGTEALITLEDNNSVIKVATVYRPMPHSGQDQRQYSNSLRSVTHHKQYIKPKSLSTYHCGVTKNI